MSENISFDLDEKTYHKLKAKKDSMGFENKSWNEWFSNLIDEGNSYSEILENVFEKKNYDVYFDDWIKNFKNNLTSIQNGDSAKKLIPEKKFSSGIVIGGGPSLKKHNHLKILANSDFDGAIICCDSVLSKALEEGVTPDKFENFFVMVIDTQSHQKQWFEKDIVKKFGSEIKCIVSTTVHPSTIEAIIDSGMQVYWVHALFDYDKGKTSFNYISGLMSRSEKNQKGFPGIQTGGNVGTAAWTVSWNILKCPEIILIGIDQSYPIENQNGEIDFDSIGRAHPILYKYVEKIKSDNDSSESIKHAFPITFNPDFNCHYIQDPIFLYYSNALKEFIQKTQNKVKTINATEGGAIFGSGIHSVKFNEYLNLKN